MNDMLPGVEYGDKRRGRSFSYRHLLYRALWNVTWRVLASWTPPQLYAWRNLLLRWFGAEVDPSARIYGSARIWYPRNLKVGKGAVIGPGVNCYSMGNIMLEDYAEVAQNVQLVTGTHDYNSETFQIYSKPIRLEPHVWIASSAFVGPGVTVKEGAVLGACGVAFRDLEPWTVYAGNPAKPVKKRVDFRREK